MRKVTIEIDLDKALPGNATGRIGYSYDYWQEILKQNMGIMSEKQKLFVSKWLCHNNMSYDEYLKSPAWRERRDEVIKMNNNKCYICGSDKDLQVHHRNYNELYNEPYFDLDCLCRECHFKLHEEFAPSVLCSIGIIDNDTIVDAFFEYYDPGIIIANHTPHIATILIDEIKRHEYQENEIKTQDLIQALAKERKRRIELSKKYGW